MPGRGRASMAWGEIKKATFFLDKGEGRLFLNQVKPLVHITKMKKTLVFVFVSTVCIAATAQELYQAPKGQQSRLSSFENPGGARGQGGQTNHGAKGHAFDHLVAGGTATLLETGGPGLINRIWMTIDDRSFSMLRSLRLRMYWDGSVKPAVDVPLGDFFTVGTGQPVAFQSALFANPEGRSFNCYIPMPFKKGARITLTNENDKDLNLLFYDIDFTELPSAPADMLYFHCCWHRSIHGAPGTDFELLPVVTGRGRYLGTSVGVNVDSGYRNTWWGEGEVKMYIDSDSTWPTINGTGAEDYIGTGWGEGTFAQLYQGCTIADEKRNQYAFYRFHIPDPVYFYQRFRATIQEIGGGMRDDVRTLLGQGVPLIPVTASGDSFLRLLDYPKSVTDADFPNGWTNFYRSDDYAATAYFYLDRPEDNLPPLAPRAERVK